MNTRLWCQVKNLHVGKQLVGILYMHPLTEVCSDQNPCSSVNSSHYCSSLTIQPEHRQFDFISIVYSLAAQGVTWGVPLGPSACEGWLPGGGVGKLQEGSARLPLHRSAAVCQDEENGRRVSPLFNVIFSPSKVSKQCIHARARCSCKYKLFKDQGNLFVNKMNPPHATIVLLVCLTVSHSFRLPHQHDVETERMTPVPYKTSCLSVLDLTKPEGFFEVSVTKKKTGRHFASGSGFE